MIDNCKALPLGKKSDWFVLLKYLVLFVMLLMSLVSLALYNIVSTESSPFFYADF